MPPAAAESAPHPSPQKLRKTAGRVEFAVWPTIIFGLGFRTLVPGEMLIHHGYWFLPLAALTHVVVHYLYAYRRNVVGNRFGMGKFVSHLSFLLFMAFQMETIRGDSHPVIVWGAYMLGWDINHLIHLTDDPVWNPINLFLVGMLAFSYYMMLHHAYEDAQDHHIEAIRFDERLLAKLSDKDEMDWQEDDFEEDDETALEADRQLHRSSIRLHHQV